MASSFLKPTKIVSAGLGVLARELTLPNLVWRDAAGDFAGALNDTISIRVPAFATARTRALRSGAVRTRDDISEVKVDVTLDTDVYKDVTITDEMLSLDIADFGSQVLNPVMGGIAMKLEDEVAAAITGATYPASHIVEFDQTKPYATIVDVRTVLNKSNVPAAGRVLVLGADLENVILKDDHFSRYDAAGAAAGSAMAEARLGRIAGFDVYTSPAIPAGEAYAWHKTAFVMSQRAPQVPAGAPFGASASYGGFALRVVRVLDSATINDILATDAWVGVSVVTDNGAEASGVFTPSTDGLGSNLFVRGVKITNLV